MRTRLHGKRLRAQMRVYALEARCELEDLREGRCRLAEAGRRAAYYFGMAARYRDMAGMR